MSGMNKQKDSLDACDQLDVSEGFTSLAWHSTDPIVSLGTNSPIFYIARLRADNKLDVTKTSTDSKGATCFVNWIGDKLVTVDLNGYAFVWMVHSKQGKCQQIAQHELRDSPSEASVCQKLQSCYVGCTSGVVYHIQIEQSTCTEAVQLEGSVLKMNCNETSPKPLLCILTTAGVLHVFTVDPENGNLASLNKVKMGSKARNVSFTWLNSRHIAGTVLAVAAGDLSIRLWDCSSNETYVLVPPESASFHHGAEYWTSVAFGEASTILSAGSNLGSVGFWNRSSKTAALEEGWRYLGVSALPGGNIFQLSWSRNVLGACNGEQLFTVQQIEPCARYRNGVAAVQVSTSTVSVQNVLRKISTEVKFDFPLRGLDVVSTHLLAWAEKSAAVFQINVDVPGYRPSLVGTFECTVLTAVLSKQFCYCADANCVQVRTFQGTLVTKLAFNEAEGSPVFLDAIGNYLCAGTKNGTIRIWEISQREPKLHINPKKVASMIPGFVELDSAKLNCDGTCVSFTARTSDADRPKLFYWLVSSSSLLQHQLENATVVRHFWDEEEPRIALCEVANSTGSAGIKCLLISAEFAEVVEQEYSDTDTAAALIGVSLPKYYVMDSSSRVSSAVLQSLATLEQHNDKATRDALITFGYHLRSGRVEQAYQAVRNLNSASVWKSLAEYSVKLLRPDVGLICLGKLSNARAARAVRLAQEEYRQPEAVSAVLAIQLGMTEEAESLCERAGCYSLLSKIYQASGRWDKVLHLAETKDRISLKQTYYNYAKHLENEGNVSQAMEMYEKSSTHHFEVPRMLYEDSGALEQYCASSTDPELLKWWAQYLESTGEMSAAMEYYTKAGDHLSLVRLQCYLGDLNSAAELAAQSQNRAACFHMARQYEAGGDVQQTLRFFAQAGAFGSAVRLCKEHGLQDQLYSYALHGGPEEQIDAARYFQAADGEREPRYDRAVLLYTRAGLFDTALDLAFKTDQHEAVVELASHMHANASAASLQRCAQYLVAQQHYDTAVELLASAGNFSEAIELCMRHDVKITEKMAEKLGPASNSTPELLVQLAEAAQQQGDYHLAAKKFTQAGDRMRAMKALLKSGDTEKIIFFANISRQREIYILAANYLQTLDWRTQPELLKHIISFYNKARAAELLAGFYESCAQVEIDEFCDYGKALGALKEALQCISKTPETQNSPKATSLKMKMELVQQCLELERLMLIDPAAAEGQLETLMASGVLEVHLLNPGVLHAKLVKLYEEQGAAAKAVQLMELMKSRSFEVSHYVQMETIRNLCEAANVPADRFVAAKSSSTNNAEEEEIKEIIRFAK